MTDWGTNFMSDSYLISEFDQISRAEFRILGVTGITSIISKIWYFWGYWPRVTLNDLGGKFVEALRSRALIWAKTCLFLATVENWPHMTLNGPMWPESNFVVEIDLKSWWLSWAIVWKTEWDCDLSKISSLVKRLIF